MDKNEVRQLIMNRRHELSDEDIEMQSELIIDRLKKSDIYKTSENVFLYMSYNREVDTYMLLSAVLYGWQESICSKSFIKDTDGVLLLI